MITNDIEYNNALNELEHYFDLDIEDHEFEKLFGLIEVYEAEHYPIPKPSRIDALEYYLRSRYLSVIVKENFLLFISFISLIVLYYLVLYWFYERHR